MSTNYTEGPRTQPQYHSQEPAEEPSTAQFKMAFCVCLSRAVLENSLAPAGFTVTFSVSASQRRRCVCMKYIFFLIHSYVFILAVLLCVIYGRSLVAILLDSLIYGDFLIGYVLSRILN